MATFTLVPLGTYPAQTRTFERAVPATVATVDFHITAPVQAAFDYSVEFFVSPDAGQTWRWVAASAAVARATDSEAQINVAGMNRVRAVAVLNTPMTVQVDVTTG